MCWCVCYLINRGNCFKASQSCIDRQGTHQMWLTDWLADSYRLYLPSMYFIASFQLWVPMRLLSWPVFFCPMRAVCLSKTLSNSLRACSVFFCCAAGVVAGAEAIDNRCCLISPWMLFLFYSQKNCCISFSVRWYAPFCSAVRGYGSSQKDKNIKNNNRTWLKVAFKSSHNKVEAAALRKNSPARWGCWYRCWWRLHTQSK